MLPPTVLARCRLRFAMVLGCALSLLSTVAGQTLEVPATAAPLSSLTELRYEWDVTTGVLWHVGGGASPLNYVITPVIVSLKIPPISERPLWGGLLVHRARLSFLMEPIVSGPEHHFFGATAAGDLEWRHPGGKLSVFFAGGGGIGWLDSKGYEVPGAQGQDFNFTWLLHSGVRYQAPSGWRWAAGLYFQHISNRGLNKVNPGINALGPTLSVSRRF